jgi:hypothetical protein
MNRAFVLLRTSRPRRERIKTMSRQNRTRTVATLLIVFLLGFSHVAVGVQDKSKNQKAAADGVPVLWHDPGDVSTRDLFLGPGGEEMKPDLTSVTFIREETDGYSVKYRVRDGAGKTWVAKLGKEAQSETAATRLLWAIGYVTEVNYLAPCVQIKGAPRPRKDVGRCEGQGFSNVRFEARPEDTERLDNWSWKQNPFTGTKELQGLIVLMAMLNNWDIKDTNNRVLFVAGSPGELRYVISDLGATFGKTGNAITHNRNEPETFVKTKFIKGVAGGRVEFAYGGKNTGLFKDVTIEQARWLGDLLARLSDEQLGNAFRAANYSAEEIQLLAEAVRARINELVNLPGQSDATRTN